MEMNSEKSINLRSNFFEIYYLDIALYISKIADKEFNVFDKCVARYVHITFPLERRTEEVVYRGREESPGGVL